MENVPFSVCSESPALSWHSGCREDKVTVTAGDCGLTCSYEKITARIYSFSCRELGQPPPTPPFTTTLSLTGMK